MKDTIYRDDAINCCRNEWEEEVEERLRLLPSAQPEPCEKYWKPNTAIPYDHMCENTCENTYDFARKPNASAQRKGKWIFMERRAPQYDIDGVKTWGVAYKCSECGFIHSVIENFGTYSYCPNCGADMRGEQDDKNT